MIQGIDHIVIVVRELEQAMADYSALGFTVVPGGRHAGLNTHNALVAFDDGCYLELIAFLGPAPARHLWYDASQKGGGLVDFCGRSDNLEKDAAVFRAAGAAIGTPFTMSRERPDGYRISWVLAVNEGATSGLVPFFIRDITPRDERVPHERRHHNLACGVKCLTIAVDELHPIQSIYEKALGHAQTIERLDLGATGVQFELGPQQVHLVTPVKSSGVVAERLQTRGASPVELALRGGTEQYSILDSARTHGARVTISSGSRS
jgi:hypothetical protein